MENEARKLKTTTKTVVTYEPVLTAGNYEQTGQSYFDSERAEYNRVLQNAINFKNKIDGCNKR